MEKITDKLYNWASDYDDGTIQQALKASRLPIVYDHISLMPDAHVGKGATIGSVIPTENAIIPSAVGVDIGCVDADTEYLTESGWNRISEYDPHNPLINKVMQYDPKTCIGSLVKPLDYIVREQSEFLYLHTKYGINQMLTPDHKMVVWEVKGRVPRLVQKELTAQEFYDKHMSLKQGYKAKFETSFKGSRHLGLILSDAQIRLQVAVNADAHIDKQYKAVVKLRKQRKIDRLKKLLSEAGVEYTTRYDEEDSVFRFEAPLDKDYSWFWFCSSHQLKVVVDEVFNWDGNSEERVFYTRDKNSADFMQYCFAACGLRSVMRQDGDDYRVYGHLKSMVGMGGTPRTDIDIVPSLDGKAYCFTVPSGFLIFRRNGNVFITGNCGMAALKTNVSVSQLPDSLEPLLSRIGGVVPAGVGAGHTGASRASEAWFSKHPIELDSDLSKTALKQFGSLGSGNHFWELCEDEDDQVWILLHSGSRGIGNKLATSHIRIAKELAKSTGVKLEDPDLAYFTQEMPEFEAYIRDMHWAQDYARGNRDLMLRSSFNEFCKIMGSFNVAIVEEINCHHNFTQLERHNGKMLWITRKGAIKADRGDRGLIPGSMGTNSYIVTGLGNSESWNSCSHGAGRRFSRSKAKQNFSLDDLREEMSGKTWLGDKAESLLDEIPSAYKNIEDVMRAQSDLVRIDHTLNQLVNFKGA